ncbi:MAG: GTPase, partial [Gammaproteobacteria bacterium]|nr:GTPase [Gammaproteobacteria bacterium]
MTDPTLNTELEQYSEWRTQLSATIQGLSLFLKDNNVTDLRTHHQFESVLGALADDNLSIAFVAEFSRGKSEMINTLFFGDYKHRILPSGTGRTTMCPTELMYDPNKPSSIRLLPIESRTEDKPLYELKSETDRWTEIVFDADDAEHLAQALSGMTDSKLVSEDYAEKLKFNIMDSEDAELGLTINEFDEVEIPCWRHAIINLPHPLLKQGLVILDTPGLNAIGAEPELTINQLASAHTVVFILSIDTGVTATDLSLWEQHLGGQSPERRAADGKAGKRARHQRKLVALNKIDGLWDGIRSEQQIEEEIEQQVARTAKLLDLDPENIFPVSAQKGLLGKLTDDQELLQRSRITDLENAIAERLVPEKRLIVVDKVQSSLEGIIDTAGSILNNRLKDADAHIAELKQISSKNSDVISHIMLKVQVEKSSLENDMQRYQALRSVYNKETGKLVRMLSSERLEKVIVVTKHNMSRCASSITLQKTISKYFAKLNQYLDQAIEQANQIAVLSENITRDFEKDHGIANFQVRRLRLEKYKQEVMKLEQKYSHLKETKTLFFREQMTITNRFYESVCSASRKIFRRALREASDWNNNLMVPLETYVREHHTQLRRRLESVKRIHKASDTVETRLKELELMQAQLYEQHQQFTRFHNRLTSLLDVPEEIVKSDKDDEHGSAEILRWQHKTSF